MPSRPVQYDVLIAAPGDLHEEIEIARRVMHEFELHVNDEVLTLRPRHWKTHTRPDINLGPQPAITGQIVDPSDMILAMFWTRRGTPTDDADSGTEDEIGRFQKAGKPGLIYFSKRSPDLSSITAKEWQRIEELKDRFQKGDGSHRKMYTGEFKDLHDFEIRVRADLERMVRVHHIAGSVKLKPTPVVPIAAARQVAVPARTQVVPVPVSPRAIVPTVAVDPEIERQKTVQAIVEALRHSQDR